MLWTFRFVSATRCCLPLVTPLYAEGDIDDLQMQSITHALRRMLAQHEPFPAVVMDRYWNVVMTNDAAPRFFGTFIDMEARQKPRNLLHLMFDPAAMRPFIPNWEETAKASCPESSGNRSAASSTCGHKS